MFINKIIISLIFISSCAFAGTIKQIKNNKVLISLDGKPAKVGDQIYGVDASNKKTSILEITMVKGDQAIAKVVKGTPQPQDKTEPKVAAVFTSALGRPTPPPSLRQDAIKIAVNLKYIIDSIASKQEDSSPIPVSEDVTMKGSNFGVNASVDYPMWSWLFLRGYGGYEMLKVTGTSTNLVCDGKSSRDCNVNINYLSAGALARFNYAMTSMDIWAGAGVGFKQPISKKSTALKEENIAMANTAIVALGLDYHLNNKYFVPASFEYHKSFNESNTVPMISSMGFQVGFGLLF